MRFPVRICESCLFLQNVTYAYIRVYTDLYADIQRSWAYIRSCTCSYAYMPRYTGFIDGYKVVYLYILICTEYSPVYTQYNIAFFSFSFPYKKSIAMLQYISWYTQTYIISRGCPGSQLSKGVQIHMRKQAYISVCTVAYLKISSFISNPLESWLPGQPLTRVIK